MPCLRSNKIKVFNVVVFYCSFVAIKHVFVSPLCVSFSCHRKTRQVSQERCISLGKNNFAVANCLCDMQIVLHKEKWCGGKLCMFHLLMAACVATEIAGM